MAEPTRIQIAELCELFLTEYDAVHGKDFELEEIPEGSSADFFIKDSQSGTRIPVQHVKAMEDQDDDMRKPERAGRFLEELKKVLQQEGITNMYLSIGVQNLPKDMKHLAVDVAYFAYSQMHNPPTAFSFSAKEHFHNLGLDRLLPYVPSIEVRKLQREGVFIGVTYADVPTTPHLSDQQILEKAIAKKREKYGKGLPDTILLVEASPRPFSSFFMDEARKTRDGDTSGFREIWVVSPLGSAPFAARIA